MAAKEITTRTVLPQQVVPAIDTHNAQSGAVRRDFIEAVVIALLAFSIGLAVAATLCNSRDHYQYRAQEGQQWLN
jgi:hypothetical protein